MYVVQRIKFSVSDQESQRSFDASDWEKHAYFHIGGKSLLIEFHKI